MSSRKLRPIIDIKINNEDGKTVTRCIQYKCPVCKTIISGYKSDESCDQCGTVYDWGDHPARIETIYNAIW